MEVIITDTVGFIRNLPQDLVVAFRATLEELESADLLLHVIDISNPRHLGQIRSVEQILEELGLQALPQIRVLNKLDRIPADMLANMTKRLKGVPICARDKNSLAPLIEKISDFIMEKIKVNKLDNKTIK
jgi:GTP-binding protein HflX